MDLLVTFPDSTYELNGIYRENGTLNGYPSCKHESKEYYIFADNGGHYVLNNTTAMPDPCYFYGPQGTPIGTYSLGIFGSGNPPTVTEYVDSSGTVTGFEVSGATSVILGTMINGTYTLTDYRSGYSADSRVFSNGTYYLARVSDNGGWYFGTTYTASFSDTSSCKTYDCATFDTQYGSPNVANPSDVKNWWDLDSFTARTLTIAPIYGEDGGNGGGDTPSGGKVIAYVVDNSGSKENHGTYNYVGDDDNGYPRYEMIAEAGMSLQIYWGDTYMPPGAMGWMLRNPGGTAYGAPNSPADSTPENAPWITGQSGSAPVPTFTPVYEDVPDEPDTPDTPDVPETGDTTITVPTAAPAVGDKGFKIGDVFIPFCPNPADNHLSRVSATGKNIALDWFSPDTDTTRAISVTAGAVYQAKTAGWLVASGAGANGGLVLAYGETVDNLMFQTQGWCLYIPRGAYYAVSTEYTSFSWAFFIPCTGATE